MGETLLLVLAPWSVIPSGLSRHILMLLVHQMDSFHQDHPRWLLPNLVYEHWWSIWDGIDTLLVQCLHLGLLHSRVSFLLVLEL